MPKNKSLRVWKILKLEVHRMDWFPAVMTVVGVLVGVGVQEFRIWRERKDKYKDMIFEKRLDAHQGAYYRCTKLAQSVRPDRLLRDGGAEEAINESWECLDWLNGNALYLDENSRFKMTNFILYVSQMGSKYMDKELRKTIEVEKQVEGVTRRLVAVCGSIKKGIGVKYLPEEELKVSMESIEMQKMLDELLDKMVRNSKKLTKEKSG
jgi:hypothetical protein